MPLTIMGALGPALLAPAITMAFLPRPTKRIAAVGLCLASLGVLYLPVDGLRLSDCVRGVTGDLSVPTLILLASSLCARLGGSDVHSRREIDALSAVVAALALALYPMALGLSPIDPYSFGFFSIPFVALLGAIALAAWAKDRKLLLLSIVASVALHTLSLGESTNLWDYLIDPFVSLYAFHWFLRRHLPRDLRSSAASPNLGKRGNSGLVGVSS